MLIGKGLKVVNPSAGGHFRFGCGAWIILARSLRNRIWKFVCTSHMLSKDPRLPLCLGHESTELLGSRSFNYKYLLWMTLWYVVINLLAEAISNIYSWVSSLCCSLYVILCFRLANLCSVSATSADETAPWAQWITHRDMAIMVNNKRST